MDGLSLGPRGMSVSLAAIRKTEATNFYKESL
jgi:hypothetical protein